MVYYRRLGWQMASLPSEQIKAFRNRLWLETQHFDPLNRRGIVLPLFDGIAFLGLSLILELRRLQVTLPVEIPHCGDLSVTFQRKVLEQHENVKFLDVCDLAVNAQTDTRPLFCVDLAHCYDKFQSFDIKVLALVYSRFEEIMLLDADTLFFQSPMSLWETSKYKNTGTLFFNDRISYDLSYLAKRMVSDEKLQVHTSVGALHQFLAGFDVTPYRPFRTVDDGELRPQLSKRLLGLEFGFQPSSFLLNSHVWKLRSGHQMDSSLLLWNKARQARATVILASFISLDGLPTAPSYGDKELYWLACELAETAYAFSDFAVGAVGWDLVTIGHENDGVLCGDALQHYPVQLDPTKGPRADVEPLYMNSNNILEWGRDSRRLYRTAARPAKHYPGSFTDRKLLQTCPFNVTTLDLAPKEVMLLQQRQQYYDMVADWNGRYWFA
ncbi:unnamed protein product [Peronospora farinosa]|uniref:Nucleotide-diphospho-sugar transferase domain-containing protein n=1 Tax=Peronospora farinosa TaxID=134698 RepID=A0AAV0USI1_9STRA|nr:unnamed protein product [Peronospora farinosa]CAI5739892.1 unnamed protein product [Peronospora farinosa]